MPAGRAAANDLSRSPTPGSGRWRRSHRRPRRCRLRYFRVDACLFSSPSAISFSCLPRASRWRHSGSKYSPDRRSSDGVTCRSVKSAPTAKPARTPFQRLGAHRGRRSNGTSTRRKAMASVGRRFLQVDSVITGQSAVVKHLGGDRSQDEARNGPRAMVGNDDQVRSILVSILTSLRAGSPSRRRRAPARSVSPVRRSDALPGPASVAWRGMRIVR